jgi:hypothetical protein
VWRRRLTATTPLQGRLRRTASWTPLLHHPSQVPRPDNRRQPPQGLHGSKTPSLAARSRLLGPCPDGPAAAKRVSFSDPLVSIPSPSAPPQDGPGTNFQPSEEVFARPGPAAPSRTPQKWYP